MYCIYRITNLVNGKTYIGQHKYKDTPYDSYMGSGKLLHKAYKKYGIDNFIKDIIIADIKDKETIDRLEIKYIAYERTSNGNGCYNIATGGEGGYTGPVSEETKSKISASKKGQKYGPMCEEHRSKIGAAKKGNKYNKGKHHSVETKLKISDSLKGHSVSEKSKSKMSVAFKGKHWKLVDGKRVWY